MGNSKKPVRPRSLLAGMFKSFDSSVVKEGMGNVAQVLSGSRNYYALVILFWVAVYASSIVALDAIRIGYHEAYGVTREIPWGLMISSYIFFVVTSTGLCIVSAIGHVFGVKQFMPIAKRAVFISIVTICSGFVVILLEVENPFRMLLYNAISPNLTSNIWWMGTLYGVYLVFMVIEFGLLQFNLSKYAMAAGLVALISGIAAHSNLGAIFGMLHAREFWYGPYMPIYFIVSAMMSGCAAIILFTWAAYKINHKQMEDTMRGAISAVAKLSALLIAVIMFFTVWKVITGTVSPAKEEVISSFVNGKYAVNFWVFEVGLGMVIPFALLLISKWKNMTMMVVASAMMIVGIFVMRYDLVVFGQIVSVFYELGVNEYKDLLSYSPSFHEMGIVAGAIGLTVLTFLLGEKVFKGHESDIH